MDECLARFLSHILPLAAICKHNDLSVRLKMAASYTANWAVIFTLHSKWARFLDLARATFECRDYISQFLILLNAH